MMEKISTNYTSFPMDAENHERKKEKIPHGDTDKLHEIISGSICGILTTSGEGCMATRTEGEGGMEIDYIKKFNF